MNRFLYAAHRWVAAAAFLQFAAWTISGTFFTLYDIRTVRGTSKDPNPPAIISDPAVLSLQTIYALGLPAVGPILGVDLRPSLSGPVFIVRGREGVARFDARSGAIAPVSRQEAETVAFLDQAFAGTASETVLLTDLAPLEYRDRSLPAWRVALRDDAKTVVYVDAVTAEITARRNERWRTYDFLWSLHIMDYRGRESFHHPLINAAAGAALLTVASGAALWMTRIVRALRRSNT